MGSMRKALLPVTVFAKISIRRAFRDKVALFFTFFFPLIFLFIFGTMFNRGGQTAFTIALVNESDSSFSQQFEKQLNDNKLFKVKKDITSLDTAKQKMARGQIDATIVLPKEFGNASSSALPMGDAKVYYTQNSQQAAQTITAVLDSIFRETNRQLTKTDEPLKVSSEQLNERSLSGFDYVFAGLLGFTIVGLGIFGPSSVFPELKKQRVLRRLRTTPLRVWQFFTANAISQTVIGLIAIALMFAVGVMFFHLKIAGNIAELIVWLVLSIVMILGIGLAVGGWARDARQAAPLAQVVSLPMLFLSGAFFPRFIMPQWLQDVSSFLPLTSVVEGIRLIATEGQHITSLLTELGLLLGWMVVIYVLAFRLFRWE